MEGSARPKEVLLVAHSDFGSSDEGVFWAIAVFVVLVIGAAVALYTGIGG